jgi:anti-anti-sigma regulatory factor
MVMIQTPLQMTILPEAAAFSHADADRVWRLATEGCTTRRVVLDLARAHDASTSAFARLVLLRRTLLKAGRDLRLTNLHDRAAGLYQVIRLGGVLPMI